MFARTYGATTFGVDGLIIDVEVDSAAGLPGFNIVGLPDTSVKESKERVRTAIRNSGIRLRQENVTINLAPAAIRKDGAGLDLPIAVGLLAAYGVIPQAMLEKSLFVAELSLEGECRSVHGILSMAIQAKAQGMTELFVARDNVNEALLVDGIHVYAMENLSQLVQFLNGGEDIEPAEAKEAEESTVGGLPDDFADVQGQYQAKRALEIAAAGGHNVLMVGVPGAGKTMLARRVSTILPVLSKEEALEVTKIYSIAGLLPRNGGLVTKRPYRSPHHTASMTAMVGGGSIPRPGEVTLAHHGVLFLDELPEFSKKTLEVLREPIEDQKITVARIHATVTYPASFMLITSLNPCPCGFLGDPDHECSCTPAEIKRYMRRISGPLLDRIDIHIRVPRVKYEDLASKKKAESSAAIRQRVEQARQIQRKRLQPYGLFCNAQMSHAVIRKECPLGKDAQQLLAQAFEHLLLSARSYDRIIKVARTIADLAGAQDIAAMHIAEAIQLRNDIGLSVD